MAVDRKNQMNKLRAMLFAPLLIIPITHNHVLKPHALDPGLNQGNNPDVTGGPPCPNPIVNSTDNTKPIYFVSNAGQFIQANTYGLDYSGPWSGTSACMTSPGIQYNDGDTWPGSGNTGWNWLINPTPYRVWLHISTSSNSYSDCINPWNIWQLVGRDQDAHDFTSVQVSTNPSPCTTETPYAYYQCTTETVSGNYENDGPFLAIAQYTDYVGGNYVPEITCLQHWGDTYAPPSNIDWMVNAGDYNDSGIGDGNARVWIHQQPGISSPPDCFDDGVFNLDGRFDAMKGNITNIQLTKDPDTCDT